VAAPGKRYWRQPGREIYRRPINVPLCQLAKPIAERSAIWNPRLDQVRRQPGIAAQQARKLVVEGRDL
jgi:hypothetical protein